MFTTSGRGFHGDLNRHDRLHRLFCGAARRCPDRECPLNNWVVSENGRPNFPEEVAFFVFDPLVLVDLMLVALSNMQV